MTIILAWMMPLVMLADVPVRIARLQEKLPCQPSVRDTVMQCPALGRGVSISVMHDAKGQLSHLGLHLFTPEMKRMVSPLLCNCSERILLELLLQKTEAERLTLLREDKVRLVLNGFPLGSPQFSSFPKVMQLLTESSRTSFVELDSGYELRITGNDDNTLVLAFPKDRELIFGTDKKEQDERMTELVALGTEQRLSPRVPAVSKLLPTDEPSVLKSAGSPFMIEQMTSTCYYRKETAGGVSVVFDRDHALQSFTNLLLGQVDKKDFLVDLTHKRYGLTPPRFNVDWASLFCTLVQPDVECFAAARYIENGQALSGVLIMSHGSYGYVDMLTVNVFVDQLFDDPKPQLRAYLFTNVPQNNIYNLFE
ncbi:MAG: hypothetical protein KBT20_01130 [Bacteroidales bacterium]|nr:hypothetical protein [Candidatus Liminaster caballi]